MVTLARARAQAVREARAADVARADAELARFEARLARERAETMEALLEQLRPHARTPASLFRSEPLWIARSVVISGVVLAPLLLASELLGWLPASSRWWLWLSSLHLLIFGGVLLSARRRLRHAVSEPRLLGIPAGAFSLFILHRAVVLAVDAPVELAFIFDYALLVVLGAVIALRDRREAS